MSTFYNIAMPEGFTSEMTYLNGKTVHISLGQNIADETEQPDRVVALIIDAENGDVYEYFTETTYRETVVNFATHERIMVHLEPATVPDDMGNEAITQALSAREEYADCFGYKIISADSTLPDALKKFAFNHKWSQRLPIFV